MLRGFYTAASGMVSQERRLNAISNNIANANTVGFKKEDVAFGTFGEHIAVRMNAYNMAPVHQHGGGVWMQTVDLKFTDFEQGSFDFTSRAFDLAIQGEGFFVIDTPQGNRLTRDGQFALDEEGYLILPGFGRVQGIEGDIQLTRSDFVVGRNGEIFMRDEDDPTEFELVDRLMIALPEDLTALEREPSKLFFAENYTIAGENPENTMILQETLESSNVNMAVQMTGMMAAQRSLQSAAQLVRMFDEMADQGNNRISSMR